MEGVQVQLTSLISQQTHLDQQIYTPEWKTRDYVDYKSEVFLQSHCSAHDDVFL